MKRLGCLVMLVALAAFALPDRYSYEWATGGNAQPCSAGVCTRSDPTLATEGMSLASVSGYRLKICAVSGQTLTGAGTMKAWAYDADEGVWTRAKDLDQAVTESTKRCQSFPDFLSGTQRDRVLFAASGVTVSGGSGLDVLIAGQLVAR